ncbi:MULTISPECIES: recombination regulator RecX [Aerococcus]|uniref:recombination regulator RecX n=1 Tax=Aerococcus TaxID=1375 RepID=UPI000845DFD5|nr:recombination regulator RecX [Aerococcus urinaeequi]
MTGKKRGPMKLSDIGNTKQSSKVAVDKKSKHDSYTREKHSDNGLSEGGQSPSYQKKARVKQTPRHQTSANIEDSASTADNLASDLLAKAEGLRAQKANPLFQEGELPTETSEDEVVAGEITLIEVQKKNKKRFNVYIKGQFAFGVSENTLVKFALHKGQVLDKDFIADIQQIDKEDYAYQLAVRFLSHQLRSEKEVRAKLNEEEIEPEVMEKAVAKLKEVKLIDDTMFGQAYTRTAMNINKKGPNVIARELKNKGLGEDEIEQSMNEYDRDTEVENAYAIAEKYFHKQLRKASHRNASQKTKQYLVQKGFDSDLIQDLMQQLADHYHDEDQELAVLQKDLEKYMRRYKKLSGRELTFKVKGMLYNKGYPSELINQALEIYEEENE